MSKQEAAYNYADGTPIHLGDVCLIGRCPGVWEIYHLDTFEASPAEAQIQRPERQYASLARGRDRTAADLHELRFLGRRAEQ